MKKNISINISGIIFYIEEDGYDKLKEYLDSINRYFSRFDDSGEIVSDIESRIAEIFLSKLKEGRQVIQLEDVESLIATMGSIRDFKAVEEPDEIFEEPQEKAETREEGTRHKRLYRDIKRKAIGGVAAGMGHYFNIDPLWIRIIFIVFFISFFFEFSVSLAIAAIYVVLWIVIPGSSDLPYERKYKKMFRNPDDKVLGGVASGMAKYFGIDVVVVRLLFVVFIFIAFSGLIAYIILWIILPEAKTITDKMEMQGEPVTLSNIEANIKKSLNVHEGEENIFIKILLFPFRLIAILIDAISKNLGPLLKILVDAIRIVAGVILTMVGLFSLIGLIIFFGVIIGIFASGNYEVFNNFPIEVIKQTIPTVIYIATFVFLFIPFLLIAILGLMVITKSNMIRQSVGWSIFAVWVASIAALGLSVPPVVANFAREGEREEVEYFELDAKTTALKINHINMQGFEDFTTLRLRGHDDPRYKLVKKFEAKGKSTQEAQENTKSVYYQVQQRDSVLIFDSNLQYYDDAKFRMQKVNVTLFVPYNHPFTIDKEMSRILRNTFYSAGYSTREIQENVWQFTEEEGLKCVTCSKEDGEDDSVKTNSITSSDSVEKIGVNADKTFNFKDFNSLDIGSVFIVEVIAGADDYQVAAYGDKNDLNFLQINQEGNTLRIRSKKEDLLGNSQVKLMIMMPEIEKLDLHGSKTYITNLRTNKLDLQLSGAALADIDLKADLVDLEMSGSTKLNLKGNCINMEAELSGIAILDALDCSINEVNINTSSAANAKLFVKNLLNAKADGGSSINYQGNPHVVSKSEFMSSIKKID